VYYQYAAPRICKRKRSNELQERENKHECPAKRPPPLAIRNRSTPGRLRVGLQQSEYENGSRSRSRSTATGAYAASSNGPDAEERERTLDNQNSVGSPSTNAVGGHRDGAAPAKEAKAGRCNTKSGDAKGDLATTKIVANSTCKLTNFNKLDFSSHRFVFSHVNIRGINSKLDFGPSSIDFLEGLLLRRKAWFCSVVESWLPDGKNPTLSPIYQWFGHGRSDRRGGGTGLILHRSLGGKDISSSIIGNLALEATFVSCVIFSKTFLFGSVYLPQRVTSEITEFLKALKRIQDDAYDHVIIGGDWNAWHCAWGCDTADYKYDSKGCARGRKLYNGISRLHFSATHIDKPTRISNHQRDTIVDFFIVSDSSHLSKIEVGYKLSDHHVITSSYSMTCKTNRRRRVFDFRRTYDSDSHTRALSDFFDNIDWHSIFCDHTLDELPRLLNDCIISGWNLCGISKYVNNQSRPWFPPVVKQNTNRSSFFNDRIQSCKYSGSQTCLVDGVILSIDDCKDLQRKASDAKFDKQNDIKENCFRYMCRQLNNDLHPTMKRIYQVTKRAIPNLKQRVDGKLRVVATDNTTKAKLFLEQFKLNSELPESFPTHPDHAKLPAELNPHLSQYQLAQDGHLVSLTNFSQISLDSKKLRDVQQLCLSHDIFIDSNSSLFNQIDVCNDYFYFQEIQLVRSTLKKGKGSRGFNNEHIRKIDSDNLDLGLQLLCNICFHFLYWPSDYRLCDIFPSHKSGSAALRENYRGISISDSGCKFISGATYNRVSYVVDPQLSPTQAGGRANHGTSSQLLRVVEEIFADVAEKRNFRGRTRPASYVIGALLDASKAFDKMKRPVLLSKLWKMGIRGRLFEFCVAFFFERRQRVKIDDCFSEVVPIEDGGPQGSKLTMLFWLVHVNDLSQKSRADGMGLFVDDVMIWIKSNTPRRALSKLNAELERIYNWSIYNAVVFNVSKFHLIDFGKLELSQEWKDRALFGDLSPHWSDEALYLGVTFDSELNMLSHMKKQISKARQACFRFNDHACSKYGCNPCTLAVIFLLWVLPHLCYGSELWIFKIKTKVHRSKRPRKKYEKAFMKMQQLYMKCARRILGARGNPSDDAVLVRLGWLPLDYLLMGRAILWVLKGRAGKAGPALSNLITRWDSSEKSRNGIGACVISPAMRAIERLQPYVADTNFLSASMKHCRTALRKAMFAELTEYWENATTGRFTYSLHPMWTNRKLPLSMHSKLSHSWYHSIALGMGPFNDRMKKIRVRGNSLCRYGCNENEDANHVFMKCDAVKSSRLKIRKICDHRNLKFDLKTILCEGAIHIEAERLIMCFIAK